MADHGNDDLVIYGYSQGATVASLEKRRLAEQYPSGSTAPDIDFVLGGDGNLPNGGFLARFPGLYIPILDISFNGPEPTDTQFDTVVITRQYDAFADFPLYPINVIADLNAVLGFFYVHLYAFDVSLAPDPSKSTSFQDTHGDTSYYFFETQDLPLFGPLRTLGVPESVIDVVEPFFRVLVELGYDRSIPPWQPTPARLIPTLDPAKVTADLVNAIGEGFNNALALFGLPPLLRIPVAPGTESATADVSHQEVTSTDAAARTHQEVTSTETAARTRQATSTSAGASEPSTKPTPQPSANTLTPKPAKPAGRPTTPSPVVRGSLGVGHQPADLHRGNGHQLTTQSAAGVGPTTAGPSSAASSSASSSTHSSPGGRSRGSDGDGS
jgi:hypothetical protein